MGFSSAAGARPRLEPPPVGAIVRQDGRRGKGRREGGVRAPFARPRDLAIGGLRWAALHAGGSGRPGAAPRCPIEAGRGRVRRSPSGLTGELVAPLKRQGASVRKKLQRFSSAQAAAIASRSQPQISGMPR